mgnify:CR=1 FL=1
MSLRNEVHVFLKLLDFKTWVLFNVCSMKIYVIMVFIDFDFENQVNRVITFW